MAGDTITTSVDGEVLDTRTDATFAGPGIVGLRTNGAETGTVHAVTVVNADGDTLLDATFPGDANPFASGTVTDDGLVVTGNADAWVTGPTAVQLLHTDFELPRGRIARARVHASAQGLCRAGARRAAGRGPRAGARLDGLPRADPVPDVRRHPPGARPVPTHSVPSSRAAGTPGPSPGRRPAATAPRRA